MLQQRLGHGRGAIIALPDLYCLFNRARGTELVSPDDLLRSAKLLERVESSGFRLRGFPSGVLVVQAASHSDEEVGRRTCRQTDRQTDRQTPLHSDDEAGRRTDGRTDRWIARSDGRVSGGGRASGRTDRWTDRWIARSDGRVSGGRRASGRTDRRTDRWTARSDGRVSGGGRAQQVCASIAGLVGGEGVGRALTARDVAAAMSVPVLIASEHLLTAERGGVLCRDDGPEGLRFFRNFFRDEGVSSWLSVR
jgi:EAP30/Vps36 family